MTLLCESMFVPIGKRTLIPKNGRMKSFSDETKASISFISMRRMSLWCPILKRKEIIVWICVCLDWQTNFNSKNYGKKSFSMKPKQQCHSSQLGEWVYGAQSKEERILLFESMFVLIGKQTLIAKSGGMKSFSYETKATMSFISMSRMSLWCPI